MASDFLSKEIRLGNFSDLENAVVLEIKLNSIGAARTESFILVPSMEFTLGRNFVGQTNARNGAKLTPVW